MNTHSTAEVAAFESLVSAAAQLAIDGRSIRSAAVKQALRRADPDFDEGKFGYRSFREFLRAAEAAGHVRLEEAPTGPDVDVVVKASTAGPRPDRPQQRVRADLWRAFTDWTLGLLRFWHPEAGRAYAVTTAPTAGEPTENASARLAFMAQPSDFVPIDHIPRETVYRWMSDFAASAPDGASETLTAALQSPTPFRTFTEQARDLGLTGSWHAEHSRLVAEHIRTWAKARDVDVEPFEETRPDRVRRAPSVGAGFEAVDIHRLRTAAHQVVDRMTVEELLNLRVRLGDALGL